MILYNAIKYGTYARRPQGVERATVKGVRRPIGGRAASALFVIYIIGVYLENIIILYLPDIPSIKT